MAKLGWRVAALKNGFQDAAAYRIEYLIEIAGAAIVPLAVQLMLWYAIFQVDGRHDLGGMTHQELIAYTIGSVLFSQVRGGDHDFELAEMIRTGQLSTFLLRPVGVIEFVYLRGVSPRLFTAGLCLIIGMIVSFWTELSPLRMIGGMGLAILGNIIHYQIGTILASTAFYWEEAYSLLMVKNLFVSILSGELVPLNLIPEAWSWVWKYTPFYLYVFGPTQYALGRWTHTEFLFNCLIALGWIGIAYAGILLSWGRGIKNYSSIGN